MSTTPTAQNSLSFLLLGLATGGAIIYATYWLWGPATASAKKTGKRSFRSRPTSNSGTHSSSTDSTTGTPSSTEHTGQDGDSSVHHQQRHSRSATADGNEDEYDDDDDVEEIENIDNFQDQEDYGSDQENQEFRDGSRLGSADKKQEGLQLMNLLYAIAEDQAGKEGHIHRGITCNSCSVVPIRGLRYKCANCPDFDLCEGCEAADLHIKSHVFIKIRVPIPPLANPRSTLLTPFYPGSHQGVSYVSEQVIRELQASTHFDGVELEAMHDQYLSLSTLDREGGGITRQTFEQALGPLGLEKNLITDRIFRFFDQDGDNAINFQEMARGLSVLCKGNFDEKIDFAFQGYDLDGDGFISREELYEMYKAYFYLSMELIKDVVKTMETDLMDSFEYQPGMPVSATFTAPIPREIGVRNRAEERRRAREQAPLPAEWRLSVIPREPTTEPTTTTTAGAGATETSQADLPEDPVTLEEVFAGTDAGSEFIEQGGIVENQPAVEVQSVDQLHTEPLSVESIPDRLPPGSYGLLDNFEELENMESFERDPADVEEPAMLTQPEVDNRIDEGRGKSDGEDDENAANGDQVSDIDEDGSIPDLESVSEVGDHPSAVHGTASTSRESECAEQRSTPTTAAVSSVPTMIVPEAQPQTPTPSTSETLLPNAAASSSSTATSSSSSERRPRPRKDQPLPATTSNAAPFGAQRSSSSSTTMNGHRRHATFQSGPAPFRRSHHQGSHSTSTLVTDFNALPQLSHTDYDEGAGSGSGSGTSAANNSGGNGDGASSSQPYPLFPSLDSARTNGHGGIGHGSSGHHSASTSSGSQFNYASTNSTSYLTSTFPVMESISQDAIQEMVDRTFSEIQDPEKPDYITLEEFRAHVMLDTKILGWFDALGSIF